MSAREVNFTFAGKHCLRDFDCIYIEQGGHPVAPDTQWAEYEIAGHSGTVELGTSPVHSVMQHTGALYPMKNLPTLAARQRLARELGAWLKQGRRQLIFDYEPDKYLLAQVHSATAWDYSAWLDGGLAITITAQPHAYNLREDSRTATVGTSAADMQLYVHTGVSTPVCAKITNTGAAHLQGVSITLNDKMVQLADMDITPGSVLTINMEPPIGVTIRTNDAITDAMPYALRFDYLAANGQTSAKVTLTYGIGDTKQASVRLYARGRWI